MFHCINSTAHGRGEPEHGAAKILQLLFRGGGRALGPQAVLGMAYNLGFGASQEFGRGLYTNTGVLPALEELDNARALANFLSDRGDLTVTPMQVAGMMNCIASGGTYSTPETHQRHGGQQPERHTGRIGGGAHGTGDGAVHRTALAELSGGRSAVRNRQPRSAGGTVRRGSKPAPHRRACMKTVKSCSISGTAAISKMKTGQDIPLPYCGRPHRMTRGYSPGIQRNCGRNCGAVFLKALRMLCSTRERR